jgi:hypothetical protein
MNSYKLPDGSQAQWFVQLPESWQEYVKQVAEKSMLGDMSIYSADIPEFLEAYSDLTIFEATEGAFFPYDN